MATQIQRLHLSFVFTQPLLEPLEQASSAPGGAPPLGRFLTEPGYIDTVNNLVGGTPAPLDLVFPWPPATSKNFWDRYMEGKPLADARGRACFEKLVPLRLRRLFYKVSFSGPEDVDVIADGYFFPFGTALLIRALVGGQFSIDETAALTLRLRRDKVFTVLQEENSAPDNMNLSQLSGVALDRLRQLGFGNAFTGPRSTLFSLATVVAATGAEMTPVVDGGPTHRFLNCLATGTTTWLTSPPPALEPGKTVLKGAKANATPNDMILASGRGTAVWRPGCFLTGPGTAVHSLGCYHRNLSFATLMTESLLGLCSEVQRLLCTPPTAASVQRIGELAGVQLGRLYGGSSTYASDSVRSQIGRSRNLPDVVAMRKQLIPGGSAIP